MSKRASSSHQNVLTRAEHKRLLEEYEAKHKEYLAKAAVIPKRKVYLTGKWTDTDEIRACLTTIKHQDLDVYDWTTDEHKMSTQQTQDDNIKKWLDESCAFILYMNDPDYEYGASRLQLGYMLLLGRKCIIVNPSGEQPRMLKNLYYHRAFEPISNLILVPTLVDALMYI